MHADPLLARYWARAGEASQLDHAALDGELVEIPPSFSPWWEATGGNWGSSDGTLVDLESLLHSALTCSPYVRAIAAEPEIRATNMLEEHAAFDWRRFLETSYDDFNDPVGNELTTGNSEDRFKDKNWRFNGGMRRQNELGGEIEIAQQLGAQRNNSRFLLPNPQGTARLALNYTHPLLARSGRAYNRSQIVLARIETNLSRDELEIRLQEHLLSVTRTYWDLYRSRTRFTQRRMLYEAAEEIRQRLAGRSEVDSLHRQVLRANAAVARRRSEIVRAAAEIDNSESRLRVLVNDPRLFSADTLVPVARPMQNRVVPSVSDSLTTALAHRRDISKAIRTLQAISVQIGVARKDLLPTLDLLLSTYIAGLEGDSAVLSAWNNQFIEGRPGFSVGLLWELPQGNRAAVARHRRRQLQLHQATCEFENTVETTLTEVEIAVREVLTSYQELIGKYHAMLAAAEETRYFRDRYEVLPGLNDSAPQMLEDLLDAQERQADEEAAFVDAQIDYSISMVMLRRATGTLLQADVDCFDVASQTSLANNSHKSTPLEDVIAPAPTAARTGPNASGHNTNDREPAIPPSAMPVSRLSVNAVAWPTAAGPAPKSTATTTGTAPVSIANELYFQQQ